MRYIVWAVISIICFNNFVFSVSAQLTREDCGSQIGTYAVAGANRPETSTATMRVYPLYIGDTLVPYEQFYGGTELSGMSGAGQLLNSQRFFWVPIYMVLVIHPDVGPFVVDTAFNTEMAFNYAEYYRGFRGTASRLLHEEYRMEAAQAIPEQLARFGYTPEDIELVILTHSHDDHVGGLPYFQNARIVLAQDEFAVVDYINANPVPAMNRYYEGVTCWEPIAYTDAGAYGFDATQDLLGDGSVILLPVPGHSPGSLAVLINMGDYHLLLTGDTVYTLGHLDTEQVKQYIPDTDPLQLATAIQRLSALRDTLPNTVIVPAHDHTEYLATYLAPLLENGELTPAERETIQAYEAELFTDDGHVQDMYLPQYSVADDGTYYGTVTSPGIIVNP